MKEQRLFSRSPKRPLAPSGGRSAAKNLDDAVKPGATYRYTVKARDIAGHLSPDSNPAAVTTLSKSP